MTWTYMKPYLVGFFFTIKIENDLAFTGFENPSNRQCRASSI